MSKIHVMDEVLANKIAAGEVIEKMMNVVKELVENSIDAKSTAIKIELGDSGVKMVKISDNGIGMDRDDAQLAFSRHATSKCHNLHDLFNIESLGFRGEALPSIASVSKVRLKTSNGQIGTEVIVEGGQIREVINSDLQEGTSITVKDIFYNTPVRLKYIKNLYSELANVVDYVNKMALSYPYIKFTLINNGKTLLDTAGDGNLHKVIYDIYGSSVARKMVKIENSNDDYEISGYISYPEVARSSRNSITTLVNNRVIRNNDLIKAIVDSYHTYIPKDKFPIIVLNIIVDPILVDVNVHPTKMDVKFSKMDELKQLINDTIIMKIKEMVLIPDAIEQSNEEYQTAPKTDFNNLTQEDTNDISYQETFTTFEVDEEENTYDVSPVKREQLKIEVEEDNTYTIKEMIPRGIVYETYVIAENEDGMYIIDQHAAAERINYEKCKKNILNPSIKAVPLLVPITIEMPKNEYLIVKEKLDLLKEIGITCEEFGDNTVVVRTHPSWLRQDLEKSDLKKIFEIIATSEEFSKEKFIDHMAATMACRMSIKANDYINLEEARYLLDELRKCENPFNCPHGRPTIITYTKYDLEKLFKRVME